ncbi:hypothetical protein RB597_009379 [Gaeumannomyces tritici]
MRASPTSLAATTASALLRLAAAQAQPADGFHLASIAASFAAGCLGAETLRLGLTTAAVTVDYYGMGTAPPRSAACVALLDLGAVPDGWRFAVDEVRHDGHVRLAAGAADASTQFGLGITNSHVVNAQDGAAEFKWSVNSGYFGTFNKKLDWAANADVDADFSVAVPRAEAERLWSPCFAGPDERRKTQLSMQTFFHFDNATAAAAQGYFGRAGDGPALRTTVPLVWEKCDPASSPFEGWGRHLRVDGPCRRE